LNEYVRSAILGKAVVNGAVETYEFFGEGESKPAGAPVIR
jgi:hypothetical protein